MCGYSNPSRSRRRRGRVETRFLASRPKRNEGLHRCEGRHRASTGSSASSATSRRRAANQALVRMRAASLNFRDLAIVAGQIHAGPARAGHDPAVRRGGRSRRRRRRSAHVQDRRPRGRDLHARPPARRARLAARWRARRIRGVRRGRPAQDPCAPVVRGSRDAAVRGRDRLERADARAALRAARRHRRDARHGRRVDLRAAAREAGRARA